MMNSFIFYIYKTRYSDMVIYLVQQRKFLQSVLFFTSVLTKMEFLLTNKTIYSHINAPSIMDGSATL